MAKSLERIKARQLREKGTSVAQIAKSLKISKSTASLWVRDIILSVEQLEKLRQQNIIGGERGRLIGAFKQKNDRLKRIEEGIKKGTTRFPTLTNLELLIAGTALYWAEGSKKQRNVMFCNSDPKLVQFMLTWLRKCFNVETQRLRCVVGINEIHREREIIVKKYWSEISRIPLSQFKPTSFKKVKNKKVYANFNDHYGTFSVYVAKPGQMYYDITGLIEGLFQAVIRQGSSVG